MILEKINALDTPFFHDVAKGVLKKDKTYLEFLNQSDFQDWYTEYAAYYSEAKREEIRDAIFEQYEGISLSDSVKQNINSISKPNTFTVTTGQQIHIFLGPAFVMNKIWCCIDHCRTLNKKHPDFHFVPVFWMASEDHDFDEISTVSVYNQKYTWETSQKGPVGRMNPSSILDLVNQIRERLDSNPENDKFLDLCEHAYKTFDNFAQATRYILHELFQESGLLILDPDHPKLKQMGEDLVIADLVHNDLQPPLDEQIDKLKSIGIKAPINTRPINHFYIEDGYRERIVKQDNLFTTVDHRIQFSEKDILLHSENMSPNAVLRPLYQQMILPNFMYVGGAGELMYWLELKSAFAFMSLPMPFFQIRTTAFVLPKKRIDKIRADVEGFLPEWFFLDDKEFGQLVGKSMYSKNEEELGLIDQTESQLLNTFNRLNAKYLGTNVKAHEKMKNRALQSLTELREKYLEFQAKENTELEKKIQLRSKYFGEIQERTHSLLELWSQFSALSQNEIEHEQFHEGEKINVFLT